nr:N-6 DNA methylase [Helcobacillus massiliensis]
MGHIFEELIRKFAEASNETAGEHFTPRDVIDLMVTLLLAHAPDLGKDHVAREIYETFMSQRIQTRANYDLAA